jgi:4a-hydroxytetrahydrobiopterin dehydratase
VTKINKEQELELLKTLSDWSIKNGALNKLIYFRDFKQVVIFFNQLALLAEKMNHHPDLKIGYNYCEIKIITHDLGTLTFLDFELAKAIDDIQ